MKPIILNGHTRPIQEIMYNREGDLIFSCGADRLINVWYSENGERLGSLGNDYGEGVPRIDGQHRSVIWSCDVTRDSLHCVSGSGDATAKLWDVSNGKCIDTYQFGSSVRAVRLSMDGNLFAVTQDRQMTHYAKVFICDRRIPGGGEQEVRTGTNPAVVKSWKISQEMRMNTKLQWGFMDDTIITADDQGVIQKWDWQNLSIDSNELGRAMQTRKGHDKEIKDLVLNKDRTIMMTCSRDRKVRLWDCMGEDNFDCVREVEHIANANSCAFNPNDNFNHIVVAGGDDAKNITTQGGSGNFETYLYNYISQDSIGYFKGHFSPVNSIAFHPNGKQIVTGAEEGNARICNLDKSYLEYKEPEMELVKEDVDFIPVRSIMA